MKHFLLILLIVLIIALAAYFIFAKKQVIAPPSDNNNPNQTGVEYKNDQYGFKISLPDSWKNYTIVNGEWRGEVWDGQNQTEIKNGPQISIRHPQWTEQIPRQDIPIMIFTLDEWNLVMAGSTGASKFMSVGAAPIPSSELGRNSKYVFALPARYNYAFPVGHEEVEQIIGSHPLQAF